MKLLNRLPLHRFTSRRLRCQGRVPAQYLLRYGPLPFHCSISAGERTRTSGCLACFAACAFARCASTCAHCSGVSLSVVPGLSSFTTRGLFASAIRRACSHRAAFKASGSPPDVSATTSAVVRIFQPKRPTCAAPSPNTPRPCPNPKMMFVFIASPLPTVKPTFATRPQSSCPSPKLCLSEP